MATGLSDEQREEKRKQFKALRLKGYAIADCCEGSGISISTFYAWDADEGWRKSRGWSKSEGTAKSDGGKKSGGGNKSDGGKKSGP